jgi:hypothetical protein
MNASKYITPLTISIAGVFATALALALVYFLLIKKTQAVLSTQTGIYNQYVQYEGPQELKSANDKVTQATVAKQLVQDKWTQIQTSRDPVIDYSNVMNAWSQYIAELNFHLAPSIEQWMPSTGIRPTQPITTPAPPADPNAVISKNPIVIPLNAGSPIQVVGTFPQILHHVAAWNNFNRIVLIDKLTLAGISPWVTGSYTATVYEFPLNGTTPGITVPSGGGGGGGGGYSGQMSSGPPMNQLPTGR